MEVSIKGGDDGKIVGVKKFGKEARILAESIVITSAFFAVQQGNGFNINTGTINLTGNATTSGLLYIKNNEDRDVVIEFFKYLIGNSTSGSGDYTIDVIRNPTAGTLITDKLAVDINCNRNFGSNNTLLLDVFKGAEGKTITDGKQCLDTLISVDGIRLDIDPGEIILKKGSSVAVKITTQTGNTSMNIQIVAQIHLRDSVI